MEICIHQLTDEIDVVKVPAARRLQNIQNTVGKPGREGCGKILGNRGGPANKICFCDRLKENPPQYVFILEMSKKFDFP